ncbi:MAG: hypothetical protein JWL57_2731 [Actinobacteria bacterium]|nr:hypothetical protein [Actinomycetota bacterium]
MLGRLRCFFAGGLVLPLLAIAGPRLAAATDISTVRADAEWVLAGQCPDGAIANHPPFGTVQPYLGSFAALGLVRAAEVTGELRYATAAWKWLTWYQSHMDASGFIDDWTNSGCRLRDAGIRDSTDAPAGLFLLALLAAQRSFPQPAGGTPELPRFSTGITRALEAIGATQDADGLTWAKPGYPVKYLMDQAETYAGLVAAGELGRALGNAVIVDRAGKDAARLRQGVEGLWDPVAGSYVWAVHASGKREAANWSVLDPDALQQVWAVAFGLAGGDRGTRIMDHFLHEQPDWSKPAALARYRAGSKATGYWAVAGWALLQTGSTAESQAAAGSIRAGALAAGRAWPFSAGDAGQLILLESGDAGYLGNAAPAVETPPQVSPSASPSSGSSAPRSGTAAAPVGHRGQGGFVSALLVAAGAVILAGGWWLRRRGVA